jgi:serine protease Do
MNTRMNKLIICWLLMLLFACSKSVEERSHTVVSIINGNTIQLKNGLKVQLIGIEDTPEAREYLTSTLLNKKIRFATDRSNRYKIKSAVQDVYAYIKTIKGVSVNGELLKQRLSSLNKEYLTDSLAAFQSYVTGDVTSTSAKGKERSIAEAEIELPKKKDTEKSLEAKPLRQLVRMAEPCVFLIYAMDKEDNITGSGTGFFINGQGLAVSNHHVFKGSSNWKIKLKSGKIYPVTSVIHSDEEVDYIIFKVAIDSSPFLHLSEQLPDKGEDIFVLGNPKGLESTVTRGVVSAYRSLHTRHDYIQIDAAISPGSSGSPVMNMQGDVIGIATAKLDQCESCNFAVNIQLVEKALAEEAL